MKDIAARLGISTGTVDRALNGKPGVSPETCARVLAAARDLGYRPNLAARYLRSRRQVRISVHLPRRASLFWDTLREGIREAAAPFAPSLAVDFHASDDRDVALLASPAAGEPDAIIVAPASPAATRRIHDAARRGIPVACVAADVPGSPRLLSVSADPFSVGALAGELVARFVPGGGEVALVGESVSTPAHAEHLRGFESSLAMVGPHVALGTVVPSPADEREAQRRVREMLRAGPRLKAIYISAGDPLPVLRAAVREGRLPGLTVVVADLRPEIFDWIRTGKVAAAVYQRPLTQGQLVLQSLHQFLLTRAAPDPAVRFVAPYAVMGSNLDLVLERLRTAHVPSLPQQEWHASASPVR
jgi:LacI family transcriptional regulator